MKLYCRCDSKIVFMAHRVIVMVVMLLSVGVEASDEIKIFELGGYRLGAYSNEHEENVEAKPMKLSKPFLDYKEVVPNYRQGRLYSFDLTGSTMTYADVAKEVSRLYPKLRFTALDKDGIWLTARFGKIYVSTCGKTLRASFDSPNGYVEFEESDPFPAPKTTPINRIFGVSLGMTVEDMIEEMLRPDGVLFEIKKDGSYRFYPRKHFLLFDRYSVRTAGGVVWSISATQQMPRIAQGNEPKGKWRNMKEVVDILKEKYGINFVWRSRTLAEYYGSGDDHTMLKVEGDNWTVTIQLSAYGSRWCKWKKTEALKHMKVDEPRKKAEDAAKKAALDAL